MSGVAAEMALALTTLSVPRQGGDVIHACRLTSVPGIRIGRSPGGVAVLFPCDQSSKGAHDIRLRHLVVRYGARCRVIVDGLAAEEALTVIECTAQEQALQELFFATVGASLAGPGKGGGEGTVALVRALAQLFAPNDRAPRTSALGLWGELFLLSRALEWRRASRSWHALVTERFDFSDGAERVEVKTSGGSRVHTFSLEQLRPPKPTMVTVVSICTAASSGGPSVEDLLVMCCARAASLEESGRLVEIATNSLGVGWAEGRRFRFDEELGAASIRYYDAERVPAIEHIPTEVSAVRFKVDLECAEAKRLDSKTGWTGLAKALRPAAEGEKAPRRP